MTSETVVVPKPVITNPNLGKMVGVNKFCDIGALLFEDC